MPMSTPDDKHFHYEKKNNTPSISILSRYIDFQVYHFSQTGKYIETEEVHEYHFVPTPKTPCTPSVIIDPLFYILPVSLTVTHLGH